MSHNYKGSGITMADIKKKHIEDPQFPRMWKHCDIMGELGGKPYNAE